MKRLLDDETGGLRPEYRYRDPRLRWFDKVGLFVIVPLVILWFALPSSLFIYPVSMAVEDDGMVTSVRRTPFGAVEADWTARIVVSHNNGYICAATGTAYYTQVPGDLVRYRIGAWALPCIEAGPPLVITYTRQVKLFGLIPLRPVVFNYITEPVEVDATEG